MKRMSAVTGAVACALSLSVWSMAASAQTMNPAPAERKAPAAATNAPQAKTKASKETSNYVEKAAEGDLFEIQSSELALKQAESSDVKAFAQRMINDHTASSQALKAGIQSANIDVKVPDKLDKAHEAKVSNLRKAKGKDFDQAYMREQLAAHKEALQLHKNYAAKGDNPVLKNTAANTATVVEHHLAEAQEIAKGAPQSSSTR
jgi:putative membrane protein